MQELEITVEAKDNEALRVLKTQDMKFNANLHESTRKRSANEIDLDETIDMPDITFCSKKAAPSKPMSRTITLDDDLTECTDDQEKTHCLIDDDEYIVRSSTSVQRLSDKNLMPCGGNNVFTKGCHSSKGDANLYSQNEVEMQKHGNNDGVSCSSSMRKVGKRDQTDKLPANVDDEVICYGDTNPVQTSLHIRNEIRSSTPVSGHGKYFNLHDKFVSWYPLNFF